MKEIPVCDLNQPANCDHRIDGKLSHVRLCGGNNLYGEVKDCPYRRVFIAEPADFTAQKEGVK
jgi:hypothetical protein